MRVCFRCPDCNNRERGQTRAAKNLKPCQDLFGSNATPEGGAFGRADGAFTLIEAQKSAGSLHAHTQLHLQCLHQHTALQDMLSSLFSSNKQFVKGYLRYKEHVSRQVYADLDAWKQRQEATEEA